MGNVTQLVVGRKFPGRIIFDGEMLGGIFYGEIVVFGGEKFHVSKGNYLWWMGRHARLRVYVSWLQSGPIVHTYTDSFYMVIYGKLSLLRKNGKMKKNVSKHLCLRTTIHKCLITMD